MDEQLYALAMELTLEEKLAKSIAQLRHYERFALTADPANGFYVCDSYGKDSCVIRHLCTIAGVTSKCHHHLTTIDPPELIRFGRTHHPDTLVTRPAKPLLVRLTENSIGPPTRLRRWCCAEYKEGARGDAARPDLSQPPPVKVIGIRAVESRRRKANWKTWQPDVNRPKEWILNPILYWSDKDLWNFIRAESIPYCSLYDEGWKRLGCIGCPMAGKRRRAEFDRWPAYEHAWQLAFERFWERWHTVPRNDGHPRWFDKKGMQSWKDLWQWWMEEAPTPDDEGCQMGMY